MRAVHVHVHCQCRLLHSRRHAFLAYVHHERAKIFAVFNQRLVDDLTVLRANRTLRCLKRCFTLDLIGPAPNPPNLSDRDVSMLSSP